MRFFGRLGKRKLELAGGIEPHGLDATTQTGKLPGDQAGPGRTLGRTLTPGERDPGEGSPHWPRTTTPPGGAARRNRRPSPKPRSAAGHAPTEAAQAQHAYDALTPMVELDRQRRAEATEGGADKAPQSVTEAAQRAGHTPTEAAQAQHAYDALTPMVELDRQRRAEATDGDSTATLDDPWGDAASRLDGGSFEDRSPEELDPGFTLQDDGNSPNPADMDKGFTPTPRASDDVRRRRRRDDHGRILGFRHVGLRVLRLGTLRFRFLRLRVLRLRVL